MEYPRNKDELLIVLELEKIKAQRIKDELELERLRRPPPARKSTAASQADGKPAADKADKVDKAAAEKTPKPAKEAPKDAASSSGTPASTGAKRSRKLDTCSACDAVGHRRTSSKCPMFGKTAAGENAEGAD